MIDTLVAMKDAIQQAKPSAARVFQPHSYIVVTLHRPALVDSPLLSTTVEQLLLLAKEFPIIFPIHPRTKKNLQQLDVLQLDTEKNILLTEPLGYLEFLHLVSNARAVLTDSGGIQEEAPSLGKPVLVMRETTERPEGVDAGVAKLVGLDENAIYSAAHTLLTDQVAYQEMSRAVNPYGDGTSSAQIVSILKAGSWIQK